MMTRVTSTSGVEKSGAVFAMPGNPFNVGFGAVVTGTVTFTVQHTFDGTNWFDHPFVADATANTDGNYGYPVAGIRINATAGTGTVTLTTLQA